MFEIIPNWHPIFVHFTVALLSLAAGLTVATLFVKSPLLEQWQIVARWALWFGAGFAIITGLTGWDAYNTVAHDTPSHAAMTLHRNWAIATLTLFLLLAAWSIWSTRKGKKLGTLFVVGMVVAGAVLATTAWRGGEVVYRYGLGVMSLPKSEGEGHNHSHGDGADHHGGNSTEAMDGHHGESLDSAHHDDLGMGPDDMDATMNDDGHDHQH